MKLSIIALFVLSISSASWAQSSETMSRFPVVQCPATDEAVLVFRQKLQDLKASIKNEANCDGIKADIKHLGDLLTKERPKFIDLIAQGEIEGLTVEEEGSVQNYVSDLTVTTSNLISVITGKDACFESDKQGTSLEFLSSLIGEGSKILALAGGPQLAPLITIAGEAISGFMTALKTIADNRQGYDFRKQDQQIAYAKTLCTFYDYKQELNTLIAPYESIARLEQLAVVLNKQVSTLVQKCTECAEFKSMVDQQASRTTEEVISVGQVWAKDFDQLAKQKAKEIDSLYTQDLGTQMYRAMKTLTWVPLRIEGLRAGEEFSVDVVLSATINEQEEIEQFLIDDQAGNYLSQLVRNAEDVTWKLDEYINNQTYLLVRMDGPYIEPFNMISFYNGSYHRLEDYYAKLFSALEDMRNTTTDMEGKKLIDSFFMDLEAKSRSLNIAVDVVDKYCAFFSHTNWYHRGGISGECTSSYLTDLKEKALLITNYRMLMTMGDVESGEAGDEADLMMAEPVVVEAAAEDVPVSADWAESMRLSVEELTAEVEYVERRN